jgi:hypothetical protein
MELQPDAKKLRYARKCWDHVVREAPHSARFMRGMAKGANLSIEHITLLTLHEEIVHTPHCTAFAATGEATRAGKTLVAMNWDWSPHLYPWPGLVRLDVRGAPRTLNYHYPGLWASAGINEHGVALMWTGAGYMPIVRPVVGVPTYVLIAEILRRKNTRSCIDYLRCIKQAGSFIFFIGDAQGDIAVIEAVPGRLEVVRGGWTMSRANHYECGSLVRCSTQKLSRSPAITSRYRAKRMADLMRRNSGKLTESAAKAIMTDRESAWPSRHQFPAGPARDSLSGMTIDSHIAVCEDRALWTCRGGRVPGPWQRVKV